MKPFLNVILLDYIIRIRSYSFLIILYITTAISYTFVPEPNANYSTIRIGEHVGYYNSAWFGYVTAIMTSIFLSLLGFYLVNNSIKKDLNTKVGQIIASTKIKNFTYLLSKTLSNFLVLLTIVFIIFVMSLVLFFLYNDGFDFELAQFIYPYIIITIPSVFFIAVLGVVFEVLLGKYSIIQNIMFFFMFSFLLLYSPQKEIEYAYDLLGSKIVIHQMEETVRSILPVEKADTDMTIGYVLANTIQAKKFKFNGVEFSLVFMSSRLLWMILGILLIIILSPIFHRFTVREYSLPKKRTKSRHIEHTPKEIILSTLPIPHTKLSMLPLIKTEILLLIRKGSLWLWLINGTGIVLLTTLNIKTAHQFILPILWFLQVHRLSDITSKEIQNHTFYFISSSFRPLQRVLTSQIIAGCCLMLFLAAPLLFRYAIEMSVLEILSIALGAFLIVSIAIFLGIITKGKKLFEVFFFFVTYANINVIPVVDYFGGTIKNTSHTLIIMCMTIIICSLSFLKRKLEINR
ncbi:hypothetical protein [Aquimarina algicola]|uniref:Uncharacterized protein n=1 Tax=Aquimarina algicola TaxID=2589995 RepID=A0A504JGB7_9FLAO|nr:hypothetical protein [Aquimarina algicola]TPN87742.1 hypothetical protein FHK87_09195 [Aquimarina algicola]